MLTLNDGRKELYQWDTGRTATVDIECDVVHFANLKYGESLAVEVKGGKVAIPNKLLMSGEPIYCWAFVKDESGSYTKKEQTIDVVKRAKPSDYVYEETEIITIQTAVENALQEAKESGDFKGEKGDKGDKGEQGEKGEPTDVQQTTGQSTTAVMSQQAVTDELDAFRVQGSEVVITGTNIFNPYAVVANKTVDYSGNIVATTNGDMISQTFKVKDGETAVTLSYVTGGGVHQLQSMIVTFFDASMKMLQQANNSVQSIPADAKYFIANIGNIFVSALGRIMIQYGSEMTTFESYYETVEKTPTYIKNECLEFVDFEESRNMYNYKTRTDNVSMNTDGTTLANALRSASDYIPCYGKGVFSAGTGAEGVYCFYNAGKTFLSFGVFSNGTENITIPVNAYYLRVSCAQTHAITFTVSFTHEAIQYERYGVTTANIASDFDAKNCKSVISEIIASGGQIKLLGDSITHGVGGTGFAQDGEVIPDANTEFRVNTDGYCWANVFKKYIEEKFGNNVINFGTRGIRSYDIVRRLEADNGYVTDGDKLLIVMIGTNNKWATTTGTLNDLKNDLKWIVDWCFENGKKLILISAPMSTVAWDTQYSDGSAVKFHNEDIDHIYKEVCHKNNMDYVPMYQRMVEYCDLKDIDIDTIFADGLHPNDNGYYIMYKLLMKELGIAYQMPNSGWDNASPTA